MQIFLQSVSLSFRNKGNEGKMLMRLVGMCEMIGDEIVKIN